MTSPLQKFRPKECDRTTLPPRRGAIGKALIAWLLTGSVGVAIVVYLIASGAAC